MENELLNPTRRIKTYSWPDSLPEKFIFNDQLDEYYFEILKKIGFIFSKNFSLKNKKYDRKEDQDRDSSGGYHSTIQYKLGSPKKPVHISVEKIEFEPEEMVTSSSHTYSYRYSLCNVENGEAMLSLKFETYLLKIQSAELRLELQTSPEKAELVFNCLDSFLKA